MAAEFDDHLWKKAVVAIQTRQAKLADAERHKRGRTAIAVVGVGCRFPGGASDPASFWRMMAGGTDAVEPVPPGRWDAQASGPDPGTRRAALLGDVRGFDAPFFGITPREARNLDPQQRLLLEVTWEALEDAGIPTWEMTGTNTGVFVGISAQDYLQRQMQAGGEVDACAGTGNSMAAGRLSHAFGWRGPSLSIDTAGSSSLVAVHLACQSLRLEECYMTVAAGVNLLLSPLAMKAVGQSMSLSPDGKLRAFDAAANGAVRGEGCGVVLLKRLADAVSDRDRIWAVLLGSDVNHTGDDALGSISADSQEALLRDALKAAELSADEVSYIEAHGAGTPADDLVELEAIKAIYGAAGGDRPICAVGTVKSSIGDLEAAAGIAGLIKVLLSLQHEVIPRHIHFRGLHPTMSLDGTRLVIPSTDIAWPKGPAPRRAGVSAVGRSGTAAHLLVEEAPAHRPGMTRQLRREMLVLPLSARSPAALTELAARMLHHLRAHPELSLGDACYTAGMGRDHHDERLCLVASSREALCAELEAAVADRPSAGWVRGRRTQPRDIGFFFPDADSAVPGMGRGLYRTEPIFSGALDECARLLGPLMDRPLLDVLDEPRGDLARAEVAQPALFAVEYALGHLWQPFVVEPDWVVGCGVGEYAAACLAGVFSIDDALRLITARARCTLPGATEPALDELDRIANTIAFGSPHFSRLSAGQESGPEWTTPDYWRREARQAASPSGPTGLLAPAAEAIVVEVGPRTALAETGRCLSSLDPEGNDPRALFSAVATLYTSGGRIDWRAIHASCSHRRIALPTYPWQRREYWFDDAGDDGAPR